MRLPSPIPTIPTAERTSKEFRISRFKRNRVHILWNMPVTTQHAPHAQQWGGRCVQPLLLRLLLLDCYSPIWQGASLFASNLCTTYRAEGYVDHFGAELDLFLQCVLEMVTYPPDTRGAKVLLAF